MFKMNPAAKEFVPAHILKKRQEEAERLRELSNQMDKINIKSPNEGQVNGEHSKDKSCESSKEVQQNSSNTTCSRDAKLESNKKNPSSSSELKQNNNPTTRDNGISMKNNYHAEDYLDEPKDLNYAEDKYLLNEGENICEFNGEQFIIPGDDDEYAPSTYAGYDFGNVEDNEDEDVCNAFEEFLENLESKNIPN